MATAHEALATHPAFLARAALAFAGDPTFFCTPPFTGLRADGTKQARPQLLRSTLDHPPRTQPLLLQSLLAVRTASLDSLHLAVGASWFDSPMLCSPYLAFLVVLATPSWPLVVTAIGWDV